MANLILIFTHKASHNKWPKVYGFIVHLLCFLKNCTFYTFKFFLTCSVFGTISLPLPICPFATFFFIKSPQLGFYKPHPQSKTFLNTWAVPSSAISCSNVVLITTPSSSMHFFSFFDVLPSVPTTTGMTLMLLMFPILSISLFSSWHLSILSFSFSLTLRYVSRYNNMNYNTTSLILIHYNNIWFSCFDLSVTLDHKFPQNLHFFIFNNTFWSMLIPFLTLFQVVFPTQFPLNYFCNITVPSLVLLLCQLFTCAQNIIYYFTFLVTHSTERWLGCLIYLVFHIVCSNCLFLHST